METNLPAGIDEATWCKTLRVIGHPWREGQRCDKFQAPIGRYPETREIIRRRCQACGAETSGEDQLPQYTPHNIPMPAVTDELLMRMLRRLVIERVEMDQAPSGDERYWIQFPLKDGEPIFWGETLDAAIILATASLEGN